MNPGHALLFRVCWQKVKSLSAKFWLMIVSNLYHSRMCMVWRIVFVLPGLLFLDVNFLFFLLRRKKERRD